MFRHVRAGAAPAVQPNLIEPGGFGNSATFDLYAIGLASPLNFHKVISTGRTAVVPAVRQKIIFRTSRGDAATFGTWTVAQAGLLRQRKVFRIYAAPNAQ